MQTSKGQTEDILRHRVVQLVHFQKQSFKGNSFCCKKFYSTGP